MANREARKWFWMGVGVVSGAALARWQLAVMRFGGSCTGSRVASKFSDLLARVRRAGLGYRGGPEFACYDPSSTWSFLRRNEIWLELEPN